jgi:hypothetical protein
MPQVLRIKIRTFWSMIYKIYELTRTLTKGICLTRQQHGRAYDDYRARFKKAIKSDSKTFFGYEDLKKKCVCYPSVLHFEGRMAYGPEKFFDLFAEFIQRT